MSLNQTIVEIKAPEKIYPERELEKEEEEEVQHKNLTVEELIERFAQVQNISKEEAKEQIGADTPEEVLKKIQDKTIEKINSTRVPMNRAQRRALKKKVGAKKYAEMVNESGDVVGAVSETAKKLNYIDLIQKLRKLNEEKEKEIEENGETTTEDN